MEEENQDKYKEPIGNELPNKERDPLFTGNAFNSEERRENFEFEKKLPDKEKELNQRGFGNEINRENAQIKSEGKKEEKEKKKEINIARRIKISDLEKMSKESQIKTLCDIALEEGINPAIDMAKKLNNPYVLDELHDVLVDKLYKELIEKGKLEKM